MSLKITFNCEINQIKEVLSLFCADWKISADKVYHSKNLRNGDLGYIYINYITSEKTYFLEFTKKSKKIEYIAKIDGAIYNKNNYFVIY